MSGTIRIANWDKFQHYKDRSPPWVKLHRSIIHNRQWHELSGGAGKLLPELWILASESPDGVIPLSTADLAWRTRRDEGETRAWLQELEAHGFIELRNHCASKALAECPQDAIPEGEGEGETERESPPPSREAPEAEKYQELVDWIGDPGPVDGFLSADPNNEKALASIYRLYATKSMTGEQTWNGLDPPDRKRIVADALEAMAGEGQKYNAKFFRRIIQDRVREHGTGGSAANGTNGRRDSGSSGRKAPGDGNGANGFGDLEGQFHIETHEVD